MNNEEQVGEGYLSQSKRCQRFQYPREYTVGGELEIRTSHPNYEDLVIKSIHLFERYDELQTTKEQFDELLNVSLPASNIAGCEIIFGTSGDLTIPNDPFYPEHFDPIKFKEFIDSLQDIELEIE